jgi:hypothetical protein
MIAAVHESLHGAFRTWRVVRPSALCALKRTFASASRFMVRARTPPTAPRLRQNNPTGKFSLSPSGKSLLGLTPSCPRGRGVGHRHRTLGWDAVDAAVSSVKFVRRAVSVSGQRRAGRTTLMRTAKSCGPDASVVGVKSCGGARARPGEGAKFRKATETTKPDSPGRARSKP